MKNPTYQDLLTWLQTLSSEQLEQKVTIGDCENGEFYSIDDWNDGSYIECNNPVLVIKAS